MRTRLTLVALFLLAFALVGCVPPASSPPPPTDHGCPAEIANVIRAEWHADQDFAIGRAMHESGCDPCAYYPSRHDCAAMPRTAEGLFGLLGHGDLLARACPFIPDAWHYPDCNARAAWFLYQGAGRSPWRG